MASRPPALAEAGIDAAPAPGATTMPPPAGSICGGGGGDTTPPSPITAGRSSPLCGVALRAARRPVAGVVVAETAWRPLLVGGDVPGRGTPCCHTAPRRHDAAHYWSWRCGPVAIGCWRGGCRRFVPPPPGPARRRPPTVRCMMRLTSRQQRWRWRRWQRFPSDRLSNPPPPDTRPHASRPRRARPQPPHQPPGPPVGRRRWRGRSWARRRRHAGSQRRAWRQRLVPPIPHTPECEVPPRIKEATTASNRMRN